jgi:tetratricopeptide (TPR) repeat protein
MEDVSMPSKNHSLQLPAIAVCLLLLVFALSACSVGPGTNILKSKDLVINQGRYDEAIALLEQNLDRNPDSAATWYWLAMAHYRKGERATAGKQMEKAFRLGLAEPYHKTGYDLLGYACMWTGQPKKALLNFNRALSIDPDFYSSLSGRGKLLSMHFGAAEAMEDLNRCLAQNPGNAELRIYRGRNYLRLKKYRKALSDLQQALSGTLTPVNRQEALRYIGWCHYYLNDFQEAIRSFEQSVAVEGGLPSCSRQEAYTGKAYALLGVGRGEESIAWIDKASNERCKIRAAPYPAADHKARLYLALGNKDKFKEYHGGAGYFGAKFSDVQKKSGEKGLRIHAIDKQSPAEKAGLRKGDVIVAVNDEPVVRARDFSQQMKQASPGTTVSLKISRKYEHINKEAVIGSAAEALKKEPRLAAVSDRIHDFAKDEPPPVQRSQSPQREPLRENTAGIKRVGSSLQETAVQGSVNDGQDDEAPLFELVDFDLQPDNVHVGETFQVLMEVFLDDPSQGTETLQARFDYAVLKDGRTLHQFKPKTLDLPNGQSTTINQKVRVGKQTGDYQIRIKLRHDDEILEKTARFIVSEP